MSPIDYLSTINMIRCVMNQLNLRQTRTARSTSKTRSQNSSSFQCIRTEQFLYIAKCDEEMESNHSPVISRTIM